MSKPPVIEDKQIAHLLKATAAYSRMAVRDHAMLLVLYGTAMGPTELASMTVDSYIDAEGVVKVTSAVRADVAHNGLERPFFWSNKKVVAAVDAYLAWRLQNKHGITTKKGAYRGLNPTGAIFLKEDGQPYALVEKALPSGTLSYSCNALSSYISRLHSNAGIEGGSAQSARRTWAVKQYRQGRDLVHIAAILGHRSVASTRKLVGDPMELADILAGAI